jgi:hypothetical protein
MTSGAPTTTQGRKMERAMGIEPTRAAPPELENKRFGAMADPKCDGRVNFRGMWGHVGIRESIPVATHPEAALRTVARLAHAPAQFSNH